MESRARAVGIRLGSIIVLILIWWIGSGLADDVEVLPAPALIAETIYNNFLTGDLPDAAGDHKL